MAAPRYGLCAHQHDSLPRCLTDEAGQIVGKFAGLYVVGETAEGHVSPSRIQGPRMRAAESPQAGKVLITDAMGGERGRQGIAVELRVVARAWYGTHVHESDHRVRLQQSNELGERPHRMAHGQYDGPGIRRGHCSRQLWFSAQLAR